MPASTVCQHRSWVRRCLSPWPFRSGRCRMWTSVGMD